MAATSADHTKTRSRLPAPDSVKTTASAPHARPVTIAPQPWRFSPPRTAMAPSVTARRASRIEGTGVRIVIGGTVMEAAITARATPPQPTLRACGIAASRAATRRGPGPLGAEGARLVAAVATLTQAPPPDVA